MNHHPKTETLAAYAAGALDEARAIALAAHLAMCDECRRGVADFEAVGGLALDALDGELMSPGALERFWSRAGLQEKAGAAPSFGGDIRIPEALRRHIDGKFDGIAWKPVSKGFSQAVLDAKGYRSGALRLFKIDPGVRMPRHSHGDVEFTLILKGAYEDELGVFGRGDFADLDGEDVHGPRAIGEEPCICLIATSAPLVFRGLFEKIAQRWVGV